MYGVRYKCQTLFLVIKNIQGEIEMADIFDVKSENRGFFHNIAGDFYVYQILTSVTELSTVKYIFKF